MQRWAKKTFLANGTWTSPAGISVVFITACGGGGGGDSQPAPTNAHRPGERPYGGNPAFVSTVAVAVTPNTTYTITVGAGGAAFTDGYDTTFGSLATFKGGSYSHSDDEFNNQNNPPYKGIGFLHAFVDHNDQSALHRQDTNARQQFASRGTTGTDSGTNVGGQGGGGGAGVGANGPNATTPTPSGNSAGANSGAGGSGAGYDTGSSGVTGIGGTGGSGFLTLMWLE